MEYIKRLFSSSNKNTPEKELDNKVQIEDDVIQMEKKYSKYLKIPPKPPVSNENKPLSFEEYWANNTPPNCNHIPIEKREDELFHLKAAIYLKYVQDLKMKAMDFIIKDVLKPNDIDDLLSKCKPL